MNLTFIKSFLAGSIMMSTAAFGAAKLEPVEYKQGNDTLEGFIVYPEKAKGPVPAILMVHNWLGNSEETKHQAERIAALGYAVFAADIYGKGIRPKDQKEAGQLATVCGSNCDLPPQGLGSSQSGLLLQISLSP